MQNRTAKLFCAPEARSQRAAAAITPSRSPSAVPAFLNSAKSAIPQCLADPPAVRLARVPQKSGTRVRTRTSFDSAKRR